MRGRVSRGHRGALVALAALATLATAACGGRGADRIERDDDAGAGVVIVRRTSDGVRVEQEVEPNDKTPMPLAAPVGIKGVIDGSNDVDRYVVQVAQPGWLSVEVTGIAGVDVVLELHDAKGEVLAHCDNGPALVPEGFPNVPVEPGAYTVVIKEFVKKSKARKRAKGDEAPEEGRTGKSDPYQLTVEMTREPALQHEREPNSKPEQAGMLIVGGEVRGYIGWRRDVDLWQLPAEWGVAGDVLDVDVEAVRGVNLELKAPGLARAGARGEALALRAWAPDTAAPTLLEIRGRRSSFDEPYVIRVVKRSAGADEAREPNDTPALAMGLVDLGGDAPDTQGVLTPGDVDVYALPRAATARTVHVTVTPRIVSPIEVTLSAGEGNATGTGTTTTSTSVSIQVAANQAAYVRIARPETKNVDSAELVVPYALRWSATGGQRVIPGALFE